MLCVSLSSSPFFPQSLQRQVSRKGTCILRLLCNFFFFFLRMSRLNPRARFGLMDPSGTNSYGKQNNPISNLSFKR